MRKLIVLAIAIVSLQTLQVIAQPYLPLRAGSGNRLTETLYKIR